MVLRKGVEESPERCGPYPPPSTRASHGLAVDLLQTEQLPELRSTLPRTQMGGISLRLRRDACTSACLLSGLCWSLLTFLVRQASRGRGSGGEVLFMSSWGNLSSSVPLLPGFGGAARRTRGSLLPERHDRPLYFEAH